MSVATSLSDHAIYRITGRDETKTSKITVDYALRRREAQRMARDGRRSSVVRSSLQYTEIGECQPELYL